MCVVNLNECSCDCHLYSETGMAVMHCVPCCDGPCDTCGMFIRRGGMEDHAKQHDDDPRMCPDCRGKGQYAGLDITCRRCSGSGVWRPESEPSKEPHCGVLGCDGICAHRRGDDWSDPDHLNPAKGDNKASDDYW